VVVGTTEDEGVLGRGSSVTDAFRYDAYGLTEGTVLSGSIPSPWRFQGKLLESTSGGRDLYDFVARSYSPDIGAFTSLDSVAGSATNPVTLDRYLYAAGNPETLIDPDGHCTSASGDVYPGQHGNGACPNTSQYAGGGPTADVGKAAKAAASARTTHGSAAYDCARYGECRSEVVVATVPASPTWTTPINPGVTKSVEGGDYYWWALTPSGAVYLHEWYEVTVTVSTDYPTTPVSVGLTQQDLTVNVGKHAGIDVDPASGALAVSLQGSPLEFATPSGLQPVGPRGQAGYYSGEVQPEIGYGLSGGHGLPGWDASVGYSAETRLVDSNGMPISIDTDVKVHVTQTPLVIGLPFVAVFGAVPELAPVTWPVWQPLLQPVPVGAG